MTMIIEIENISKEYRIRDDLIRKVLEDVSLKIKKDSWIAISGPSGSGKSTLMKIIFGSIEPDEGNVEIKTTKMVYLPQYVRLKTHLSILENLMEVNVDINLIKSKLSLFGFNSDEILHKNPTNLSGGELSRISLFRAYLFKPEIILLDEPTSNLDIKNTQLIIDSIKEMHNNGTTIIVISHSAFVNSFAQLEYYLENYKLNEN